MEKVCELCDCFFIQREFTDKLCPACRVYDQYYEEQREIGREFTRTLFGGMAIFITCVTIFLVLTHLFT